MLYSFLDKINGGELHLRIGEIAAPLNYYHQKHPKDFYTIAYNDGPPQEANLDGVTLQMPANSILPIMFSQVYSFSMPSQVIVWQFNREFYCIVNHDREVGCAGFLFYGSWGNMVLPTDSKTRLKLQLLIEVFKDEYTERDEIQGAMLRMLLVRLIITITRAAKENLLPAANPDPAKFDLVRHYNLLVERHYKQQHEVNFYAGMLFKSPKTLANVFAKSGSRSPLLVIHDRLAIEARRLLSNTEMSVKEIAGELGFEDAGHFTRFFKKQTGKSPSDFKRDQEH